MRAWPGALARRSLRTVDKRASMRTIVCMPVDRSAYFQEWYAANKSNVRASRRDRYASDPEYAEECRKRAREYREGLRTSGKRPEVRVARAPVMVTVAGRELKGWTVRRLAEGIGRSVSTVNHWQRHGILPETPLRTAGGVRLYTDPMIRVVKRALRNRSVVTREDLKFCGEIRRGWSDIGVSKSRIING